MLKKHLTLSVLLICACLFLPKFGQETLAWHDFNFDNIVFAKLRLPQLIIALLAGSALSVSGMTFQTIFRNDLASPFTLGVSSASSFGVCLFILISSHMSSSLRLEEYSSSFMSIAAFIGALSSLLFISALLKFKRSFTLNDALLTGVALSLFFASAIMTIQYVSDANQIMQTFRRMIGSINIIGFQEIIQLLPFYILSLTVIYLYLPQMNLLISGQELARTRGVNIERCHLHLFIAVSLLTGSSIAICGPIAFVGMIVPHIARLYVGNNQKVLFFYSLVLGGVFLAFCDTLGRVIIAPGKIPVGIITSFLGAPFFFYLILSRKSTV